MAREVAVIAAVALVGGGRGAGGLHLQDLAEVFVMTRHGYCSTSKGLTGTLTTYFRKDRVLGTCDELGNTLARCMHQWMQVLYI